MPQCRFTVAVNIFVKMSRMKILLFFRWLRPCLWALALPRDGEFAELPVNRSSIFLELFNGEDTFATIRNLENRLRCAFTVGD